MIDTVSMLAPGLGPTAGKDEPKDQTELFARVLAKEVRSALPDDALGGEWADVFGPMLDDMLAVRIADDLRAAAQRPSTPRPLPGARRVAAPGPGQTRVTSGYGMRMHPTLGVHRQHDGVDLGAARGTAIRAGKPGVVVRAEDAGSYGNLVVVDHGDGITTRYAHCDRLAVKPGDRVEAGTTLGTVGSTGRSTGPHLHFEVRVGEESVDPQESRWNDLLPQLGTP